MTKRYLVRVSVRPRTDDFYIDNDETKEIEVDNTTEALNKALEIMTEDHYIEFSKTAIKNKEKLYIDDENGVPSQGGWIVIGKVEVEFGRYEFKQRHVDCWIEIDELKRPQF